MEADVLISVAHFKGHEITGFGGTLKNVGMGCAARKGKLEQHSDLSPKVKSKKCVGCATCLAYCAQRAISLKQKKAYIDPQKCVGCGECILVCPEEAIQIQWSAEADSMQKKMAEYALGTLAGKKEKSIFLNFLTQISPACDCYGHCDAPIVHDIGITASADPVALDKASVDLVNQGTPLAGSCLGPDCGSDKFRAVYPNIDWNAQLQHAERLGLGTTSYDLIRLELPQKQKKS